LWRLLTVASADELRPIVAGTPAQPFLDPDNARMFRVHRSVTGTAIAALEYIERPTRAAVFRTRVGKGSRFSWDAVSSRIAPVKSPRCDQ